MKHLPSFPHPLPPAGADLPGPGAYGGPTIPAAPAISKFERTKSFTFGSSPGAGAGLQQRPRSPGPGAYSAARADSLTRPTSASPAMHAALEPAYLPRPSSPPPTAYSPTAPGSAGALKRGWSFSRRGHAPPCPSSHATGAADDGVGVCVRPSSPPPGSYSPSKDATSGWRRAASFSFGARSAQRDPAAAVPGPGAYDLE